MREVVRVEGVVMVENKLVFCVTFRDFYQN